MNTSLRLATTAAILVGLASSSGLNAGQCNSQRPCSGGGQRTLPYYSAPPVYQPNPGYQHPIYDSGNRSATGGPIDNWLPPDDSPVSYQRPDAQPADGGPALATIPDADLPVLTVGETLPVQGVDEARGLAQLKVGGLLLNLSILDWKGGTATLQLPKLEIDTPVRAELRVLTAAGDVQRAVEVMLEPSKRTPPQRTPALPTIVAGDELKLNFDGIRRETGKVKLKVAGVDLNVAILEWKAGTIVVDLPNLPLSEAVPAELQILAADGSEISRKAVEFAPATQS